MVLDNDGAEKREGVEFTYKKKKGFQPFHITWGPYLVDAIFPALRGSKHSNHGHDYIKAVTKVVKLIRQRYKDVPIILRNDSGFMSDENFRYFEERLGIHYVCQGKMYNDIKDYVQQADPAQFESFENENQSWHYLEFANRLKSWDTFRRCIFIPP